jgi:SAM-dependent methyltransferase
MDRIDVYEKLSALSGDRAALFREIRELPIDVVGDLMLQIPPEFHALGKALPSMASDEVQIRWTGTAGFPLLIQSCGFVRAVESGFWRHSGRSLDNTRILDYGCGWGRLIRLMYKFTAPENIYGCDPWNRSIEICREHELPAHFAQSEYIPTEPPFPDVKFDLIYAFSVFTHLSARSGKAVMDVCRRSIADNGLMVITIRPASYWYVHQQSQNEIDGKIMLRDHAEKGFAYTPHPREPIDGDITYGDTSMTLAYIEQNWPEWKIAGTDLQLHDPYQTLVFLKPRPVAAS